MPTTVAASGAYWALLLPRPGGTGVSTDSSLRQRTVRSTLSPHICAVPDRYRSERNGIAISIVHPPSNRPVARSQMGFQSPLYCTPTDWPSLRPPMELMVSETPLRRS